MQAKAGDEAAAELGARRAGSSTLAGKDMTNFYYLYRDSKTGRFVKRSKRRNRRTILQIVPARKDREYPNRLDFQYGWPQNYISRS